MSSKAQGLSLNTIVIAAIVLVVLLILVGLTTGYFGKWKAKFSEATETSCAKAGGTKVATSSSCPQDTKQGSQFYEDVEEGQKCCIPTPCNELPGDTECVTGNVCSGGQNLGSRGCGTGKTCCLYQGG